MDLATTGCTTKTAGGDDVVTLNCIPYLIHNIINAGFALVGTVALIFIIYSGIKMIRSSGDPKQFEGARQTMIWAIIGLVVVLLSVAIVNFIAVITKVPCI